MTSTRDDRGFLGLTHQDSEPVYPPPEHPAGPNIALVLFDDLGFADLGCYGAEVRTPNIDRLAANGHRYNNFHTTTLCSPSRACLLTGRNHHSVGMRMLSNVDSGWPSGRGRITRRAALISEVLREAGYNTFAAGKWHVAPMRETSPAGPFDEWPLGRGFNQFYGFMNGAADHYYPELVHDNHTAPPPAAPEEGYHLTADLVDRSIGYIADHIAHAPRSPFFLYLPLGAAHAPHHAPAEFMQAVRGRYDEGWDAVRRRRYERQLAAGVIPPDTELPPSNPDAPPWSSLRPDEQRVAARLQEAYAAFVEHTDQQLGRLVGFLERSGRLDNTVIIITSDNGAAMEGGRLGALSRIRFFNDMEEDFDRVLGALDEVGGPRADSHYATGWAQASNTPLRWYKYHTHGGGIRDPLIIHWPGRLAKPGGVLDQFHHIIDLAPTVYEIAGVEPPAEYRGVPQMPMHGKSLAYTFENPAAPTVRRVQYFEMFGNRGLWADGWKAVTRHYPGAEYGEGEWELYHLDRDFSEARNLASTHPGRLRILVDQWWRQAGRYDVLPLDDRSVDLFRSPPPPGSPLLRRRFDYFPPLSTIEPSTAPPFGSAEAYRIEAVLSGPMSGVIAAYGNAASGFVLYADDGTLHYEYNSAGNMTRSALALPDRGGGPLTAAVEYEKTAEGAAVVRLQAGGEQGGPAVIENPLAFLALAGMDIGRNRLSPVSTAYRPPFAFAGRIERVRVTIHRAGDAPELLDD